MSPHNGEKEPARIIRASADEAAALARLQWLDTRGEEPDAESIETFAAELAEWWTERQDTHFAFVAQVEGSEPVGMAWLALVPRVPRPGATCRISADVQSVFVRRDRRGVGIGSSLVRAAADHAMQLGVQRVTVHSGRRAVSMYERLGFASSRQLLQFPPP